MQKENLVGADELVWLEVSCRKCKTVVGMDVADFENYNPAKCPRCGTDFGLANDSLSVAIDHFRKFSLVVKNLSIRARFRITETPAKEAKE
jgi:phage FluMu protein Com